MKYYFFFLLLIFSFVQPIQAQKRILKTDEVYVSTLLKIRQVLIDSILTDSTLENADHNTLATALAVKQYIDSLLVDFDPGSVDSLWLAGAGGIYTDSVVTINNHTNINGNLIVSSSDGVFLSVNDGDINTIQMTGARTDLTADSVRVTSLNLANESEDDPLSIISATNTGKLVRHDIASLEIVPDSSLFATVYMVDTAAQNIRAEIADTSDLLRTLIQNIDLPISGIWVKSDIEPDTLNIWVDRNAYDGTTVFEVKDYLFSGWKTVGYIDTVNYAFSSQPPIYIVATGQSNITPRAGIVGASPSDTIASPLTSIWRGDTGSWETLHTGKNWMNGTSPARSVWCMLTFGKEAAERDKRIVKIVYAGLGGQKIEEWVAPDGEMWDTLSQRIIDSNIPRLDGVVYYQGESDGWDRTAFNSYENSWNAFVNQLESVESKHPSMKIIAVQIKAGTFSSNNYADPRVPANTLFNQFANDNLEYTYVVKNSDAVVVADSSHIDAPSQVRLGKRLYDTFSGKTQFNPIPKYSLTTYVSDTVDVNFTSTVVSFDTPTGDATYIRQYKNFHPGWNGIFQVIHNDVSIIPPDGQMFCYDTLGLLTEIDTLKGRYISPAFLQNDSLYLTACPAVDKYSSTLTLPLQLGVFAWYDSSLEEYLDGDVVTTLSDHSGNNFDMTATGSPLFARNEVNFHPVIVMNSGSPDYFTFTGTEFSFLHNDSSTIVVVFNPGGDVVANPDSLYAILTTHTAPGSAFLGYSLYYDDRSAFSSNEKMISLASNGAGVVFTNPATATEAGDFNYVYTESDPENATGSLRSRMKINDQATNAGNSSTNGASATTRPSLEIGRYTGGTPFYFTGKFVAALIFDRILTPDEEVKMDIYINRRFNVKTF